jgi:hypothetical protein
MITSPEEIAIDILSQLSHRFDGKLSEHDMRMFFIQYIANGIRRALLQENIHCEGIAKHVQFEDSVIRSEENKAKVQFTKVILDTVAEAIASRRTDSILKGEVH